MFLAATFALFNQGVEAFDKAHEEGLFDLMLGTNLTYLNPDLATKPWFQMVDVSKYIALIIATLNHDASLSKLLSPDDRIARLLERHRARQQLEGQIKIK